MDLKTQQMIYALDALTVSIKLQLKTLERMKALMAPKKVELREDPARIFTFEPPVDMEPNPPCLHCPEKRSCSQCLEKVACDKHECQACDFEEFCGEEPDPVCLHCLDCDGTECNHYLECAELKCADCSSFKMCMEIIKNV
jgi:hypothetical protein